MKKTTKKTEAQKSDEKAVDVIREAIKHGDFLRVANLNHQVRWDLTDRANEGAQSRQSKSPLKLRDGMFATDRTLFVAYADGQTAMFKMPGAMDGSLVPGLRNDLFLGYVVPTGATKAEALAWARSLSA